MTHLDLLIIFFKILSINSDRDGFISESSQKVKIDLAYTETKRNRL